MDERTYTPTALVAGAARGPLGPTDTPSKAHRTFTCLLVEDDDAVRLMVANYLEENDVHVICASRLCDVAPLLARNQPDLIVLDLHLGREDGLDLLRELRARSNMPVIIMTGHFRDEIDRIVGLELGADDYITKPFCLRELLARIRAILRRLDAGPSKPQRESERGSLRFGGWRLERRARRLTNPRGEPVALTKGQYTLLTAFLDAPQRPLSREYLLQATRIHEDVFDRSIDMQVMRLRRKLGDSGDSSSIIRSERGVGYVFTLPVETS